MCITMTLTEEQRSLLRLPNLLSEVNSNAVAVSLTLAHRPLRVSQISFGSLKSTASSKCRARSSGKRSYKEHKRACIHNYHDHLHDPIYHAPIDSSCGNRGGVQIQFPEKLYNMLESAEQEGFEGIVSWQPHGRCFRVHQPPKFVKEVLPDYFNQTKVTSFQRQLALYGFARITQGPDKGGYYHELFLRGRPDLQKSMSRCRVKGTGHKKAASPETEPVFSRYKVACVGGVRTTELTSEPQQQCPGSPIISKSSCPEYSRSNMIPGTVSPEMTLTPVSISKAVALPPCPMLPCTTNMSSTPVTPCASVLVHSPSESSFASSCCTSSVAQDSTACSSDLSYASEEGSEALRHDSIPSRPKQIHTILLDETINTGKGSFHFCTQDVQVPALAADIVEQEDFAAMMEAFANDEMMNSLMGEETEQDIAALMTDPIFLL